MKKAMMYLLLALGITLGVIFIAGALVGFIAGFIEGFTGNKVGFLSSATYMPFLGFGVVLVLCIVLNYVFLKNDYASYTIGRIPTTIRWKVFLGMIIMMCGMAVLFAALNDVAAEREMRDELMINSYAWMKQHPVFSFLVIGVIEATGNLVIFGAVLREILEWKHRPQIVILVYGMIMALASLIGGSPMLMVASMLLAQFEALVYEYTRSVIPIIIGDMAYWALTLVLIGIPTNGWWLLIAAVLMIPGLYLAVHPMEPYKPID